MGRKDAVQFTLEWAAEARRLGAIVDFEPGWETRGNGTSANYEGGVVHHTAFLSSEANPFPAKSTLKNGRPDLSGPLCNVAGPWCADGTPRLVVIAAHPANHAGASGGKSMGPLPVTSLFNPRVFGLEIDYGGLVPMTKGQLKAATIFARALCNVLRVSPEYVRGHAETSITGKWDPGYANGKTIDLNAFRAGVANFSTTGAFLMALSDAEQAEVLARLRSVDARTDWYFIPDDDPATPGDERQPSSKGEFGKRLRSIDATTAVLLARLPVDFADRVAAKIQVSPAAGGGITRDDVKAAVKEVFREVGGAA